MKFIILILLVSFGHKGFTQEIDWQKTIAWKLYDLPDQKAFQVSADSLSSFKSMALNTDSMRYYLATAKEMPKGKNPSWMGVWVTTCETEDHILYKIDISMYGGFLYDEHDERYFELPKESRASWMAYFNKAAEQLH